MGGRASVICEILYRKGGRERGRERGGEGGRKGTGVNTTVVEE